MFARTLTYGALSAALCLSVWAVDMNDFFPEINGNLTKITWAHAVNDKAYLQATLNNSTIMMIEADVIYGKVNGTGPDVPIMGHPGPFQLNISNLSLEDFLDTTYNFNKDPNNQAVRKGVKLDFKTIDAFEKSIELINRLYDKIDYPIWINADITPGPVDATGTPVDPDRFLSKSKNFTESIMSLGWTTNYGLLHPNASYSDAQIAEMVQIIGRNEVTQNVTFAVRAGIAAQSLEQMKILKKDVVNSTLTVWSSEGDPVDVEKLRTVIFEYGVDRVFIDVPQELRDQLDLGNSGSFFEASLVASAVLALFVILL